MSEHLEIYRAAQQLAAAGAYVFPVRSNKLPAIKWGESAPNDPLDVAALVALEAELGALPTTLCARTGRDGGGTHYYFAVPPAGSYAVV